MSWLRSWNWKGCSIEGWSLFSTMCPHPRCENRRAISLRHYGMALKTRWTIGRLLWRTLQAYQAIIWSHIGNIIYIWLCRSHIIFVASFASLFFIHSSPNFWLYRNFSLKPIDPKTLRESFWTLNNAKIKKTKPVSIIVSWKTDAASASSRKLGSLINFGSWSWGRNRNASSTKYVFLTSVIFFSLSLIYLFSFFDLV